MPIGDCDMVCAGNGTEFCGGPNRLSLYNYTGTDLPSGGNGNSPVRSGLPSPWTYAGCYV